MPDRDPMRLIVASGPTRRLVQVRPAAAGAAIEVTITGGGANRAARGESPDQAPAGDSPDRTTRSEGLDRAAPGGGADQAADGPDPAPTPAETAEAWRARGAGAGGSDGPAADGDRGPGERPAGRPAARDRSARTIAAAVDAGPGGAWIVTIDGRITIVRLVRRGQVSLAAADGASFTITDAPEAAAAAEAPGADTAGRGVRTGVDPDPASPARPHPAVPGDARPDPEPGPDDALAGDGVEADPLAAPMPGAVTAVLVEPGAVVRAGDPLVRIEAMKMELAIRAPTDGRVAAVACRVGDLVQPGRPLVTLDAAPAPGRRDTADSA